MPRHKPWDAPGTLLLPHTLSPEGSLPQPSQGISSDSPDCCDAFDMSCPPKQPRVYCPGFWGLHSLKANFRCWWKPEVSFTATSELSRPWWDKTWLGRYVQRSGQDLLFPERFSVNPFPYCFDSGFSPDTLQMFWLSPVLNPPEFLVMFICQIDEHSQNFQWF
jgi:hypothetical protein